jgi:hypothetical protein
VQQAEKKNKNKKEEEEEEFFSLFLSFRRSLIYRQTKQREAFDSFDRLHFSFFCCCCLSRKERAQWQWHIDAKRKREVPIYNSRINDEKEKRKHSTPLPLQPASPSTQKRETDRRLAGASDSFSFFFLPFVRFYAIAVRRFDVCLFSSSSLSFVCCVSTSLSLSVAYGRDYYPFRWFSRLFFLKKETKKNWRSQLDALFSSRFI